MIPLGLPGVEYRYLVCRRFPAYHEDEDEDCYIIRHWEAGVKPRYKSLIGMTSILSGILLRGGYKSLIDINHL